MSDLFTLVLTDRQRDALLALLDDSIEDPLAQRELVEVQGDLAVAIPGKAR